MGNPRVDDLALSAPRRGAGVDLADRLALEGPDRLHQRPGGVDLVVDDDRPPAAHLTPVSFAEEAGEKGPQASTVRILGKHGLR